MITRPSADARPLAVRLAGLGWSPVIAPMLHIEPSPLALPGQIDGIVITSGNAIPSIADRSLFDTPMLAVGDATAARARGNGFRCVSSAGGDAPALAAAAERYFLRGAALLLPTAEGEGLDLERRLEHAGFVVNRRVAYSAGAATRMPEAAIAGLRSDCLHAAIFLSARTAHIFANLLPPNLHSHLKDVDALVIGQPAADALAPLPWRQVRVSLTPTLDQVLLLL